MQKQYEKSAKDSHPAVISKEVMSLTLQEGMEFNAKRESINSKRESNNDKLFERGMTAQTNLNPFLKGDYLEDLNNQENFMKPQNSNMESELKKVTENN